MGIECCCRRKSLFHLINRILDLSINSFFFQRTCHRRNKSPFGKTLPADSTTELEPTLQHVLQLVLLVGHVIYYINKGVYGDSYNP